MNADMNVPVHTRQPQRKVRTTDELPAHNTNEKPKAEKNSEKHAPSSPCRIRCSKAEAMSHTNCSHACRQETETAGPPSCAAAAMNQTVDRGWFPVVDRSSSSSNSFVVMTSGSSSKHSRASGSHTRTSMSSLSSTRHSYTALVKVLGLQQKIEQSIRSRNRWIDRGEPRKNYRKEGRKMKPTATERN